MAEPVSSIATAASIGATLRDWGGWIAAGLATLIGLRVRWSKANREVASNEAEAEHSTGLVADLDSARNTIEANSKLIQDLVGRVGRLETEAHFLGESLKLTSQERDDYKKIAEQQTKVAGDLSRQVDSLIALQRHEKSNLRFKVLLLQRTYPDVDFTLLVDTQPGGLG